MVKYTKLIYNIPDKAKNFLRIWNEWREKSGKLMRQDYKKYIDLLNKAAILNGNFFNNCLKTKH